MANETSHRLNLSASKSLSSALTREHPTAEQLKEYAFGFALPAEVANLEQHLLDCRSCLELLEQLSDDSLLQKISNSEITDADLFGTDHPIVPTSLKLVAGYEIREEIGRGGMGVVYRAWQPGLGRLVALKRLLNPDVAGKKALDRFRNEATVLATLKHPNIVDVYDVGEQDGQPYIAMELVEGIPLAEELREKLLGSQSAAQLLIQLADAVAAAHELGIIHRDLKPQNVLISNSETQRGGTAHSGHEMHRAVAKSAAAEIVPSDATTSRLIFNTSESEKEELIFIPKLVDFGLSRLRTDEKPITETAELLGTPGYMAPEQLTPNVRVTQAADVYGLGAILYQCLTGRAPFQGANAVETMALVLSTDILPIGKLRRDVPRDLQIICHHCLEKEPNHRYASAAELREDLSRFVEGRPIHAKPPGFMRRIALWTRRNQMVAALTAAILGVVIFGIAIVTSYQNRLKADRDRATQRYADARATIWRMIDSASAQSIFEVPKLQALLAEQAEESIALFEQLAREEGSEQAIIDLARLRMLLGTISIAQGEPAEGEALLKLATEAIANIPVQEFETESLLKMTIAGQVKLATSLYGQGKTDAALEALSPAKRYAEVLVRQHPDSPDNLNQLAWIHHVSGSARIGAGDISFAKSDFQLAVDLRERAREMDPHNVDLATFLAGSLVNLALCESSLGNRNQSLNSYIQAIEILKSVQPLDSNSSGIAIVIAGARLNASNILAEAGDKPGAVEVLTEAMNELQPFLDAAPDDFQFREYMFKLAGNRAMYGDRQASPEQVIADWTRALDLANREEDRQLCRGQLLLEEGSLSAPTEDDSR